MLSKTKCRSLILTACVALYVCSLRAMGWDGMAINAQSEGGDAFLCDAALKAVQVAKIPPAPSDEVYKVFKNTPLDFRY